jgi:Ca-activated chloride channel homolog
VTRLERIATSAALGALFIALLILSSSITRVRAGKQDGAPTPGSLQIVSKDGSVTAFCPLKHTDVQAEVSGAIARVTVTQEFVNTSEDKIEAVYVFPLPQNAAVDDMTMQVGDRNIRGIIKERGEARKIYEHAKQTGHVAALLDQERPNIFTQSVTNIVPGANVRIVISYVEVLKYEEGHYEFMFPMVVGPRYIPGDAIGKQAGGWAPDTTEVPDASRITPPVAKPETRAGHDISVSVTLDAGVPIRNIRTLQHKVSVEKTGASSAVVRLDDQNEIPNRDFILRYDVAGGQIDKAVLTHREGNGPGYFTMILQPPERFAESDVTPKEIVFVLDTSGSMMGHPIEKGKELVGKMLTHLHPKDTFNLITFSGDTAILFPEPVYATPETLGKAKRFLDSREGGGGTEMMKAIRAALDPSDEADHIRVVCFVTDGFVGNDMEIVGAIKKHPNARVFSFGIGSSVNRFLLDKMAEAGRGEVEYVTLQQDGSAAANRLFERMRSPLLTDITVDWGGLPVVDVYPELIPDVFAAKPVVLYGRFTKPASGTVTIHGKREGAPYEMKVAVNLPEGEKQHDVLSSLWARKKIDHLMAEDWTGMQGGEPQGDLKLQITQLGLEHRLMTQFTSFVAVEEQTVTEGGEVKTVQVPVDLAQGVSYEGVFGKDGESLNRQSFKSMIAMSSAAQTQTVEVTSEAPMFDTTKSSVTTTIPINVPSSGGTRERSDRKSKRDLLEEKVDEDVLSAWDCHVLGPNNPSASASCKDATREKVHVRIEAKAVTEELKKKLVKLGFVQDANTDAKTLVGMLPIAKLKEVTALGEVTGVKMVVEQPRKGGSGEPKNEKEG